MSLEQTDYTRVTKPTKDGNKKQVYPITNAAAVLNLNEAIDNRLKELGVIK